MSTEVNIKNIIKLVLTVSIPITLYFIFHIYLIDQSKNNGCIQNNFENSSSTQYCNPVITATSTVYFREVSSSTKRISDDKIIFTLILEPVGTGNVPVLCFGVNFIGHLRNVGDILMFSKQPSQVNYDISTTSPIRSCVLNSTADRWEITIPIYGNDSRIKAYDYYPKSLLQESPEWVSSFVTKV